jgi:hypothetical protein
MDYTREPQTPKVNTALMQTIRIVHIAKPAGSLERSSVDEKIPPLPPSTASSSKSSFTFKVPREPRTAPILPQGGQSIVRFSFGGKAPSLNSSVRPAKPLIFGLPRKHFYAYLGGSIILFLTSIIIGLAVLSSASNPFIPSFAGLAASTASLSNSTQQNAAIFFQDPSSNALSLRISPDVDSLPFSPPRQLDLMEDQFPTQNLSLSATSFASTNGFDSIFHQLFYVIDKSIIVMNLSCPSNSPAQCEIISQDKISTTSNSVPTMAPDSGIAAVYIGTGWKVFYHNDEYAVSCASYENGMWNSTGMVVGSKAARGSSIAAVVFGSSIEILYVDQATNMLFSIENMNGLWMSRKFSSCKLYLHLLMKSSNANLSPPTSQFFIHILPISFLRTNHRCPSCLLHRHRFQHLPVRRPFGINSNFPFSYLVELYWSDDSWMDEYANKCYIRWRRDCEFWIC